VFGTLGRMRAGLLAAAFVLAAASPAVAAPAQVPCTNIGGGHYECDWFRPGNGLSGGSLVVVGTQTVGYLHQGRNWIICQQVGGDMRNPEGDRNNWFGYTQADNDKWGWASAIEASGGDDYGPFGGGVPNCNGAHGSPPAYDGEWGHPPAPGGGPPTPGVDADHDGFSPPVDCDDFNSRVHPGAVEVPNDGIDQDCNGADAAGRLSAVVSNSFSTRGRWTRVSRLRVNDAPPGATVAVTCAPKRRHCPKPRTFTTDAQGKVTMTRMFKHRLRYGARIEVTITAPNTVGKVVRFHLRRGHTPKSSTLCLPPGAAKPSAC
jgi:Putative metal-binding motif